RFILPFKVYEKKVSEKQFVRLLQKGSTVHLKGFKKEGQEVEGLLRFNDMFQLILEPKKMTFIDVPDTLGRPKSQKGIVIIGITAYGCSAYNEGCDFRVTFDDLKQKANNQELTKKLVSHILSMTD